MVVSCCCCSDLLCLSGFWGEFKTPRPQIPADFQRDVLHNFFFLNHSVYAHASGMSDSGRVVVVSFAEEHLEKLD